MRRKIGKAAAVAVAAMSVFLFVCCTLQEDVSLSDMAVEEVEEAVVSEDEVLTPPLDDEMETGIEEIPEETDSGEGEESGETAELMEEDLENKNLIFYVCDDKVWENELFRAFLEGEMTAYDRNQEELTWQEYFKQEMEYNYGLLLGMQLAAEDLDGDGNEELMIMFDDHGESTDLYVFHEEDGKLYAWDKIVNFFVVRGDDVVLREGGIFEDLGSAGAQSIVHYTWRLTEHGEEDIWVRYEEVEDFTGEDGKGYIQSTVSLSFYEDGECVKELSNIWQMPEWQTDWGEAELVEGDEELDEVYSALIDGLPEEVARFSLPEWADDAVEIPIWEVPGGQGWISVEDPPGNYRKFEYVGEENMEGEEAEEPGVEHDPL